MSLEAHKYWNNLLDMPWVLVILLIGVVNVLSGIGLAAFTRSIKGIWFTGIGTVLTVLSLFFLAGFNQTAFYPSSFDLASSLTIENASSSEFTPTVMSYVSLFIPVVVAYIWITWRAINKHKMNRDELTKEGHLY